MHNLLVNCGGLTPDETLLIVHEPPGLGYYDDALAEAIGSSARRQGFRVELLERPFNSQPVVCRKLARGLAENDVVLFLARIGDQMRFQDLGGTGRAIVCYALDLDTLASPFGAIDHSAMKGFAACMDRMLWGAEHIHLTCPAGTDLAGRVVGDVPPKDTNTRRFPQLVYSPLPAEGFSGRIAQRGFLVGTGSFYYDPFGVRVEDTLMVQIEGSRITGFQGAEALAARAHYEDIAARFGIDPWFVHSWHGGLHPACAFHQPAAVAFGRWSGGAFGNPRLAHVHTCGAYAPGEISLNIVDHTLTVDGVAVWEYGRLHPERVPGAAEILAACPDLAEAFRHPAQACGLDENGALSA